MLGRRKHARFVLSEPVDGRLKVREEVAIERWDNGEVVVLSPDPMKPEEHVLLEFPGDSRLRVSGRVSESRPVLSGDGPIRHRVRLSVDGHGSDADHAGGYNK